MQSTKLRVQAHRAKLRKAGFKPVQIWVPDPSAPGFAEECERQSRLALEDPDNLSDLLEVGEIAEWGER